MKALEQLPGNRYLAAKRYLQNVRKDFLNYADQNLENGDFEEFIYCKTKATNIERALAELL